MQAIPAGPTPDCLNAGDGDDDVTGGVGGDLLTGGGGNDWFVFAAFDDLAGTDVISDFAPGHDKLDLTALHLTYLGTEPLNGVAGSMRFEDHAYGGTLEIDADGDATADCSLTLTGVHALEVADLLL